MCLFFDKLNSLTLRLISSVQIRKKKKEKDLKNVEGRSPAAAAAFAIFIFVVAPLVSLPLVSFFGDLDETSQFEFVGFFTHCDEMS